MLSYVANINEFNYAFSLQKWIRYNICAVKIHKFFYISIKMLGNLFIFVTVWQSFTPFRTVSDAKLRNVCARREQKPRLLGLCRAAAKGAFIWTLQNYIQSSEPPNMVCRWPTLVCRCRILHLETPPSVKNRLNFHTFCIKMAAARQ